VNADLREMSGSRRGACKESKVREACPWTDGGKDQIHPDKRQGYRNMGDYLRSLNGDVGCCAKSAVVMNRSIWMSMRYRECPTQKNQRNTQDGEE